MTALPRCCGMALCVRDIEEAEPFDTDGDPGA